MPDLTPMTRQEKFLNGDTDLEPITRREHFYAGRESELPAGHQEPETREEWFIKKYRGGGGGDITVESLSVTSNGTYTAPSGKAYSPVNVNVPLPQNAYLLKSVTTPTPIASFTDGEEMVMPTLKVAIEPQQEGSGDPSPTNIRPISGWSNCVISVANAITDPTVEHTYTIDLDGTRYGGEVDVINGIGKMLGADITITENDNIEIATNASGFLFFIVGKAQNAKNNNQQICDRLIRAESGSASTLYTAESGFVVYENGIVYFKVNSELDSVASIKNYLSSNPIHIFYKLATPLTIQLTPTAVKSLEGINNLFADCGQVQELSYFSKEV